MGSIGRINAFSFCQDKIMTTGGEGGMVTTDDAALWSRAPGASGTTGRATRQFSSRNQALGSVGCTNRSVRTGG